MRGVRALAPSLLAVVLLVIPAGMAASGCAPAAAPVELEEATPDAASLAPDPAAEEMRSLRAQQLFVRGMTYAQTGDEGAALDLYAQALRLAPDSPAILAASAELYEENGDLRDGPLPPEQGAMPSLRKTYITPCSWPASRQKWANADKPPCCMPTYWSRRRSGLMRATTWPAST